MKRILAAAAALSLAAACWPATVKSPASQPTSRCVVATYNINYANVNLPKAVESILASKADVVFLQETNRQSERYLRRRLARTYPYIAFHHAPAAGGMAFLSKVPLSKLRRLPAKYGWFGASLANAKLNGRKVLLANVHLVPTDPRRAKTLKELMGAFTSAEAVRLRELKYILSKLPRGSPMLLGGDFNSPSGMPVAQLLASRGWIDSAASVAPERADLTTWHWDTPNGELRQRLDYIYHTAEIRCRASRVIRSKASDHDLVVSTLEWAPKRSAASRPAVAAVRGTDQSPAGASATRR